MPHAGNGPPSTPTRGRTRLRDVRDSATPPYFRTIFGGSPWLAKSAEAAGLRAAGDEAFNVLRGLVVEGLESGQLRPGNPEHVSLAAWSLVHGLSMLTIDGQLEGLMDEPAQVRAITDALLHMLTQGLAPAPTDT